MPTRTKKTSPASYSVLVVDDEQTIRQILVRIVRRDGYAVQEAVNGKDALEKMSTSRFDLVITDVKMPEIGGLELLAKIKSNYPDTKVVIVTSHVGDMTAAEVISAGADQFIEKPFKNFEISRTLADLMSISRKVR